MLDAEPPITPLNVPRRPTMPDRVPLQPKNTPCNHTSSKHPQSNLRKFIPISPINYANNKENHPDFAPPTTNAKTEAEVSFMDASLAEELNAVRQRLRMDRDTTERMLRLRDRIFEMRLQEFMLRGEFQKQIEIEVDPLYRLKQFQLHSMRTSPIREMQKRTQESPSQSENSWRTVESIDRSVRPSFRSESTLLMRYTIKSFDCH